MTGRLDVKNDRHRCRVVSCGSLRLSPSHKPLVTDGSPSRSSTRLAASCRAPRSMSAAWRTANRAAAIAPVTATDQGIATFAGLRPGRYVVKAEFPGFDTDVARDVRVRAGDNKQTLVAVDLQKLTDEITVGRDKQEAAADRAAHVRIGADARADRRAVRRSRRDAAAAARTWPARAPSSASTASRAATLPPKSQIKSIHVTRDGFAAENHNAGAHLHRHHHAARHRPAARRRHASACATAR